MRPALTPAALNVARRLADETGERIDEAMAWRRARPCVMAEHHRIMLQDARPIGRPWHRFWRRFWRARCLASGFDPHICGDGKDG